MIGILYGIAAGFAVYYITLVLTTSDGVWSSLARFRALKAVDDFGLLNCFICTSFWVAMPFGVGIVLLGAAWYEGVICALFLAGLATLINRLSIR